jgi:hypothetical protein
MRGKRNVYMVLVGKTEGKRPLEKPKRRRKDAVLIGLSGLGREGMHWIHLSQDRDNSQALVNTVMSFQVP